MQKMLLNEMRLHLELTIPVGTQVLVAAADRIKGPRVDNEPQANTIYPAAVLKGCCVAVLSLLPTSSTIPTAVPVILLIKSLRIIKANFHQGPVAATVLS